MLHVKQVDFSALSESWGWRRQFTHDAITEDTLKGMVGHVYDMVQTDHNGKVFGAEVAVVGYGVDHIFNEKGEPATVWNVYTDDGMAYIIYKDVIFRIIQKGVTHETVK